MFVIVCRGSKVADYEVFTGKKRDRFGKQTGQIWEADGTDLGNKRDVKKYLSRLLFFLSFAHDYKLFATMTDDKILEPFKDDNLIILKNPIANARFGLSGVKLKVSTKSATGLA